MQETQTRPDVMPESIEHLALSAYQNLVSEKKLEPELLETINIMTNGYLLDEFRGENLVTSLSKVLTYLTGLNTHNININTTLYRDDSSVLTCYTSLVSALLIDEHILSDSRSLKQNWISLELFNNIQAVVLNYLYDGQSWKEMDFLDLLGSGEDIHLIVTDEPASKIVSEYVIAALFYQLAESPSQVHPNCFSDVVEGGAVKKMVKASNPFGHCSLVMSMGS